MDQVAIFTLAEQGPNKGRWVWATCPVCGKVKAGPRPTMEKLVQEPDLIRDDYNGTDICKDLFGNGPCARSSE